MKNLTINLDNVKNNIRSRNAINSATHDLALYLMLKHKLFRTHDNVVLALRPDGTLKRVDLRAIINEEIAPVQANSTLVNNVTSYFKAVALDIFTVNEYNRELVRPSYEMSGIAPDSRVRNRILEEVQRLEDLKTNVTIN